MDLAGNVWEWCLNEYEVPENCQLSGYMARVVRGGSWFDYPDHIGLLGRNLSLHPNTYYDRVGFRVLCEFPIE